MPIFEYHCSGCGLDFERLVRSEDRVACPECGSARVKKQLSVVAAPRQRGGASDDAGGCCSGGGCSCRN
ncbi:MAG: zinc ribbon domain-containing protein [Gemmatimonadales bacterium]|jgi:putative FmdB family regulatory protein